MATQPADYEALQAISPTPIAELSPELSDPQSRAIEGDVTITWPFSASKRMLAFILADHDFRKRRNKGQVRVEFHGSAGKALDKAKIASGDSVRLSLVGAEWQPQGPQTGLTGEPLRWQLSFSRRLVLVLKRLEATETEGITVDDATDEEAAAPANDAPLDTISPFVSEAHERAAIPQTPLMNVSTKRLASTAFDNIEEFVSPAFLKRAKVSYGSLFEGGFDAMEEESARRNQKGRPKSRFSMPTAAWRYSSRSPSPDRPNDQGVSSGSEDELPVPGLSFSKKKALSSTTEPEVALVEESFLSQKPRSDHSIPSNDEPKPLASQGSQLQTLNQNLDPARLPVDSANIQDHFVKPLPADWTTLPLGEQSAGASDALPLPSPLGQVFDFGIEGSSLTTPRPVDTEFSVDLSSSIVREHHQDATSNQHPDFSTVVPESAHSVFSVEHPLSDYHSPRHESEHRSPVADQGLQVSSPISIVSQQQPESPRNVGAIEILSSSPVRSHSSPPQEPPSTIGATGVDAENAEVEEGSDENVIDEDEQYEDEDAEGSEVNEANWTHDVTPNDDADVPGEDYDLRKYDDAHEDDEEGNTDRDSLLSTDGEGNVIPANPAIISPSSSDYEQERDIDGEEVVEDVDYIIGNDDAANPLQPETEDEDEDEGLDEESDMEGVEDEEMVYGSEEEEGDDEEPLEEEEGEEYESEADDSMHEDPRSQEPIFIDLLSDSDDEAGEPAKGPQGLEPREEEEQGAEPAEQPRANPGDLGSGEEDERSREEHDEESRSYEESADETTKVPAPEPAVMEPVATPHAPQETSLELITAGKADSEAGQQFALAETEAASLRESEAATSRNFKISTLEGSTEDTQSPLIANESSVPQKSSTVAAASTVPSGNETTMQDLKPQQHTTDSVQSTEDVIQAAQNTSHPTELPDQMELDSSPQPQSVELVEKSALTEKDALRHDTLPEKEAVSLSSATLFSQDEISATQMGSMEPPYHTQPAMSFPDTTLTLSSLSSQTVANSQVHRSPIDAALDSSQPVATGVADERSDETRLEKVVQQLITPSDTQQAEPIVDVTEKAGVSGHEPSPGPDDQLHREMKQREAESLAQVAPGTDVSAHFVTEEEELAAIEDEAEHDPTLAEKDYIITAGSLRSHDRKDHDVAAENVSSNDIEAAAAADPAPPTLQVPPRRSHRKTRSSGSVDLATGGQADDASQKTVTQQPSQEDFVSQELGTTKQPGNSRTLRSRKGVTELDVDAANISADNTVEGNVMSLRSSPRGHRRATSDATAEEQPRSPLATASSPKADKPSSSKAQLLRMLQSDLPEFLPLKMLRGSLHQTVDILAIAAVAPFAPIRPKNGPRDYMLELILTDPSTAPSGVSVVQIYRPHQTSLPVVKVGDVILLRRFQVLAMKGRGFGLRAGDDSAWAVFEREDKEKLPQIMGPPVEVTEEEIVYVMALAGWWEGMGDEARKKVEKAGEKAKVVPPSGDGK